MKLIACLIGLALVVGCRSESPADLAIVNVTIVDVETGLLLPNRTVIIQGERIQSVAVSEAGESSPAAQVIDAAGQFLIPGLWDMHTHSSRARRAEYFWPLFLAHGITGVREMGSQIQNLQKYRSLAERPGTEAPRIVWGAMYDGVPPVYNFSVQVPDASAAQRAVEDALQMGIDFIKVYDRLSRDAYFSLAEASRARGIPFAGHVPLELTVIEASDAGQRSIEHLRDLLFASMPDGREFLKVLRGANSTSEAIRNTQAEILGIIASRGPDPDLLRPTLERLAANGTWLTAELTALRGMMVSSDLAKDPRLQYVPRGLTARWEAGRMLTPEQEDQVGRPMLAASMQILALAHRAGVPILAGTDASGMPYVFAGSGLHDQLELMVQAGISPLEALRSASLNPALYFEDTESYGRVRAGGFADLVLLRANPLEDIRNTRDIVAVIANGRLIDAEARTRLLQEAARAAANIPIEESE